MKRFILLTAFLAGFPALAEESEIFTNVYVVPPIFLAPPLERRPSAVEVLSNAGIDFPEGTSAIYNTATSQLTVRTTEDRMTLVDTYLKSIVQKVEKQIYVTFREIESDGPPRFLGDFFDPEKFAKHDPRKSSRIFDSREKFLEALSHAPTEIPADEGRRRGVVGIFTDPQFQVMIRAAREELGLKEIPAASVMARSGQHALAQVGGKRWGVVPVNGSDNFTIDLEFYLPSPGEAFFPDGPGSREPEKITIWDGQTIAWAEEKENESWRIVFITAVLMDPAGMPINPEKREE